MKIDKNHSVAILGSGESGMGALRLAAKQGMSAFVSDFGAISADDQSEIKALGYACEGNGHTLTTLLTYDIIVKSPGIPDTAQIIVDLAAANKVVISEIEFAYHFNTSKVIAITGSNGKTTTTLLTTHLLQSAGINAVSAGNVGKSFSALIAVESPDVIVLELSSFQLDGIIDFKSDTAILLNVTPDHLDRYEYDIQQYADSKFRIAMNMTSSNTFIYNMDDAIMKGVMSSNTYNTNQVGFSLKHSVSNGAYFTEGCLVFENQKNIQVMPASEMALLGQHNLYNQMAAVLAVQSHDVSFTDAMQGLSTFVNAPHRLERIATIAGVQYINDSKATNVDAVYYALDAMTQPVVWIAGGVNKGNDYDQIANLVKNKVKALICLGVDNQHLIDAFGDDVETTVEVTNAQEAVSRARELTREGDVVLLSPACASFDLFDSFEQRGDFFRNEVLQLKQKGGLVTV